MKNEYWHAAEKIERYGWIKREYGNKRNGYCMLGAIAAVGHSQSILLSSNPVPELSEVVHPHTVWYANDRLYTSETEVIVALSLAACIHDDGEIND